MKKSYTLVLFVLLFFRIGATSRYVFNANGFESSAANLAMGGSPIAAVNYWQNDALKSLSNPAFSSLRPGISFSTTKYNFMDLYSSAYNNSEKLYYKSGLLSIGYAGLGLVTSISPPTGRNTDIGEMAFTNLNGTVDYRHFEEKAQVHGISVNLVDFYQNFRPGGSPLPYGANLAIGMNIVRNTENYNVMGKERSATSSDLGILMSVALLDNDRYDINTAVGATISNPFGQTLKRYSGYKETEIFQRLNIASGVSISKLNPGYTQPGLAGLVENVYSARLMAGFCEEFSDDPLILGFGAELALADMLYLRSGYHYDNAGKIEGFTYGGGINLHYHNIVGLRYDIAAEDFSDKEIQSWGINLDLLALIGLMN